MDTIATREQMGQFVGAYLVAGEPAVNVHGYLLTKQGEFVAVNYPGHTNTIAQRILPDGTILGCRHDDNTMGSMKGITISRQGSAEIGQFASMNNGATTRPSADRRAVHKHGG